MNLADSDRRDRSVLVVIPVVHLLFPQRATPAGGFNDAADGPDALNMAGGVDHAVAELRDGSIDIRRAVP